MAEYTFSTQNGKAYYHGEISKFISEDSAYIVGQLVSKAFEVGKEQTDAWENQISELQQRLGNCDMQGNIIFEYDIVRLGKRIDVILLIRHMVFSLEFKNGKNVFTAQDAQQAEDYALDIKNFHKESADLYVCPILIATEAKKSPDQQSIGCYDDKQIYLQKENMETLIPKVSEISDKYGSAETIDFEKWFNSPYNPTPTIIAAAVEAYRTHNLSEIAKSKAGQSDIDNCEDSLHEIISYAKENRKKCICFVTGVPGAGKTLVGLDVVAGMLADVSKVNRATETGVKKQGEEVPLGVYVSGNGSLVQVLRKALKNSVREKRKSNNIATNDREKVLEKSVDALIQGSFEFKKEYAFSEKVPTENILIFDEAQRCWDESHMKKKHKGKTQSYSEPHMFFDIMSRRDDWAVMICLVGLGQDIYDGEVGVNEWFNVGIDSFTDWEMYYSNGIFKKNDDNRVNREKIESCTRCFCKPWLHLNVPVRTFKSDQESNFVDYLLDNDPLHASEVYSEMFDSYPIYITRDIKKAKKWAKSKVRGSQRCGVLASSGAQRLKPEGIFVSREIDTVNWFLAPSDDLRSSNMMEVVASEFKVQGLEIDWAVVCWDADLRRNGSHWDYYNFRGTKWVKRNQYEKQRYLTNSYRVLLTRARQGMVLFVPKGATPDEGDVSRNPRFYDEIFDYLISCGIKELE